MKQHAVFERKTYAETEFEITRSIEAYRKINGDVELRIAAEREGNDPVSLTYTLSAVDAEKLGRVLLCIDDTNFDELVTRATNEVRANTSTRGSLRCRGN